jgi:hypothetical protein
MSIEENKAVEAVVRNWALAVSTGNRAGIVAHH